MADPKLSTKSAQAIRDGVAVDWTPEILELERELEAARKALKSVLGRADHEADCPGRNAVVSQKCSCILSVVAKALAAPPATKGEDRTAQMPARPVHMDGPDGEHWWCGALGPQHRHASELAARGCQIREPASPAARCDCGACDGVPHSTAREGDATPVKTEAPPPRVTPAAYEQLEAMTAAAAAASERVATVREKMPPPKRPASRCCIKCRGGVPGEAFVACGCECHEAAQLAAVVDELASRVRVVPVAAEPSLAEGLKVDVREREAKLHRDRMQAAVERNAALAELAALKERLGREVARCENAEAFARQYRAKVKDLQAASGAVVEQKVDALMVQLREVMGHRFDVTVARTKLTKLRTEMRQHGMVWAQDLDEVIGILTAPTVEAGR